MIAIVRVGNCASSLVQGLEYYRYHDLSEAAGLIHPELGGYRIENVEVVAAFDSDPPVVPLPWKRLQVRSWTGKAIRSVL